jgi:predicted dehydrogenase
MQPQMSTSTAVAVPSSRREFIKTTGKLAAASALAGVALPHVHAAEDNTIRLALIGCGPRGTGAVADAIAAEGGPVKLVAMADVFQDKMDKSFGVRSEKFRAQVDVPRERQFLGFDAYRKAMDCLRPGDVAMLTTRSAFRPLHFEHAVEKGLNVFMEKSFAPDPAGTHRLLQAGEAAEKKNLKVACGVMCRHSSARQALIERIRGGALGELVLIRAYRLQQGNFVRAIKLDEPELMWQLRHPIYFHWVSSGLFIDNIIHHIDECCWLKDAWPVSAQGMGGREANSVDCSQNLHSHHIEYTFADGTKATVDGRFQPKCYNEFSTFVHGTKCAAQFSGSIHAPTVFQYRDQRAANDNVAWRPPKETISPYTAEWSALLTAIRKNRPHNETKRAAFTNYAALMGRAAVHGNQVVTWEEITASKFSFFPGLDSATPDTPAPVKLDAQGRYPVPVPGSWTEV